MLSPWKGGGFGMFAVVDQRFLTARIVDGGVDGADAREEALSLDDVPRDLLRRAKYAPSAERLERVARLLVREVGEGAVGRSRDAGTAARPDAERPTPDTGGKEGPDAERLPIRVVVWRVRFDGDTGRLWREPLRELTYRTDERAFRPGGREPVP